MSNSSIKYGDNRSGDTPRPEREHAQPPSAHRETGAESANLQESQLPAGPQAGNVTSEFEQTIQRLLAIQDIEPTPHGDLAINFGKSKTIALTPFIASDSAEVAINLRRYPGGMAGIKTDLSYLTENGLRQTSSLSSRDVYHASDRDYGLMSLAHLEGLAIGVASVYGKIPQSFATEGERDGVAVRPAAPHTDLIDNAINKVRSWIHSPRLDRPITLEVRSVPDPDRPESVVFSIGLKTFFGEKPLLRIRLDGGSPTVEAEFIGKDIPHIVRDFATTDAAAFFIIGVANGVLTAETAQRYNSSGQRLLRFFGIDP